LRIVFVARDGTHRDSVDLTSLRHPSRPTEAVDGTRRTLHNRAACARRSGNGVVQFRIPADKIKDR
jgi:hypothetical protein